MIRERHPATWKSRPRFTTLTQDFPNKNSSIFSSSICKENSNNATQKKGICGRHLHSKAFARAIGDAVSAFYEGSKSLLKIFSTSANSFLSDITFVLVIAYCGSLGPLCKTMTNLVPRNSLYIYLLMNLMYSFRPFRARREKLINAAMSSKLPEFKGSSLLIKRIIVGYLNESSIKSLLDGKNMVIQGEKQSYESFHAFSRVVLALSMPDLRPALYLRLRAKPVYLARALLPRPSSLKETFAAVVQPSLIG